MTAIPASNVFGTSVTSMEAAEVMGHSLTHHAPYHGGLSGDALPVATRHAGISAEEEIEGRPVHPSSKALFRKCNGKMNWVRYIPIFGEAIECYGPLFTISLNITYFLSKGMAYQIIGTTTTPMFLYKYNCTAVELNRYNTVTTMGWSIKPFTAMLSDAFAFFGYKKRWIMTVSAIFACVCSIAFGILPAKHSSSVPGAVFAFLVGYGQANIDILCQGLYSRRMRQFPKAGPALISGVWVLTNLASLIASVIVGPLTDANMEQVCLYVCGACMFVCIPFYMFNWLVEEKNVVERRNDMLLIQKEESDAAKKDRPQEVVKPVVTSEPIGEDGFEFGATEAALDMNGEDSAPEEEEELYIPTYCGGLIEFNKEVLVRNWRITLYCVIMTATVIITAVITLLYGTYTLMGVSLGGTILLNGMAFWVFPLVVAKAGLFGFINQAFYVNITGPLQSFYLASDACNPGGPAFSYFFYNTISGVIGSIAGTLGVVGFAYLFSRRTYRLTFIVTIFAEIVGSVFDLIIVKRWNLPAIPDHYFYIFGDAVVYQAAYSLAWMPYCVLLSQLCPRGSEAMVYALLAALSNYGQTMASEIGTLMMELVWPVPADLDTNVCDFGNLWKLIVFGHMGLPFLILVCVFFLIPAARVCDELDAETGRAVVRDEAGNIIDPAKEKQNDSPAAGGEMTEEEKTLHNSDSNSGSGNSNSEPAVAVA